MLNDIIQRLQYIDNLIRQHKTGNAEELATAIGVSARTVYKYLDLMKKLGAPIAFNALDNTYYYERAGSFICAFSMSHTANHAIDARSETIQLSVISINKLLQHMNDTIMPNNN